MSIVLDASLVLSWFFEDERTERSRDVLERVAETGANVPTIWHLEVANGLQTGIRRGRIDTQNRAAAFRKLGSLPIIVDLETGRFAWSETLRLADSFALTIYDATYLELARRLALPLATRDKALAAAARASNLEVMGDV